MTSSPPNSLERYFRSQAIRWALIGFVVTLLFALPCILYSAKLASERQLLTAAKSAARAFRPMILQSNIRDAEFQMKKALELRAGESAIVRDPSLNAVYPLEEADKTPRCFKPSGYCWAPRFESVSLLYPIYFDSQKPEVLYGYLELTMKPALDWTTVSALIVLLLAAFVAQAFGLSSALTQSARQLVTQLSRWADHLRRNPSARPPMNASIPFSELHSMQSAVDGLYIEIERLREEAAQEGKIEGQFSLLREISHDLKTPHSLLAKYFALHVDTVQTTGKSDPNEVAKIQKTLKQMGELLRQVRVIPLGSSNGAMSNVEATSELASQVRTIVDNLKNHPEAEQKKITIENHFGCNAVWAHISPIALYRILENLFHNAVEAVNPESGHVLISVDIVEGIPTLVVRDNGCGIPPEIRNKILAFNFTTKPSRGTGLGLGIVDKICSEFGADLRFDSVVGEGTTFTVAFKPVVDESRAPAMHGEVSYGHV